MKITCQACQAKYTIADEKVVGKVVKIRCKKCGATIVVTGSGQAAAAPAEAGGAAPAAFDYAKGDAFEPWTVNVDDGDQRTMTELEVAGAYRSGIISDETFCWKEGMSDWLPLGEIAALHAVCASARAATSPPSLGSQGEGPTARAREGGAHAAPSRPKSLPPAKDGNGAATVVARRAGGRAPDNDLFGSAAKAGGEDDVLTSAPAGDKLTGARNENSVLFALNPLTDKGAPPPPAKMTATNEASGLIDIRQLSAQMRSNTADEKKKNARVDDIMNLGGGGFSPTLAAPVLSAPSLDHISTPPPPSMLAAMGGETRNRNLIVVAIGAGVFFVVASILLVFVLVRDRGPSITEDRERPSSSASASEPPAPGSGAPAGTAAAAPAMPTPEPRASSTAASASATNVPSAKEPPFVTKESQAPREPPVATTPKPAAPVAREAPATAAVGAPGAEFNMGEARATLGGIASGVQSCKRGDATGSGKVVITFAPSGSVQSASVLSGSPFDGTLTAKCVEARFRAAHVPAFNGGPFPVTKSFNIN